MCIFQSTHPGWGATPYKTDERYNSKFQSTHPGWGATLCAQSINNVPFYFNPRTPGGVRRYLLLYQQRTSDISIHAPRVGCDLPTQSLSIWTYPISIHAPRVGCDLLLRLSVQYKLQFQSTHPGWGATEATPSQITTALDFNPRTPGGVRQQKCIKDEMAFMFFCAYFSICM